MRTSCDSILPLAVAALGLLLVAWVYWPGQVGPALLDDRSSVMVIGDLKEDPQLAWDYITGDKSGPLGRPVSMVSFVLEKLYLDSSLAVSKRVNILLHLFNGSLVIWLFWLLFRHIATPGYRWLAIVLGMAWLLSPLYVSTVLYVVQRMAMLSTTFMLLACISFVYWREALYHGRFAVGRLVLILLSFVLAILAKENAIVVIPVLLLMEALWFQFMDGRGDRIRWLQSLTLAAIAIGGIGLFAYLIVNYEGLAATFGRRYFTLDERLLTQARIVWTYVTQLYFPDVSGMGLYHDDVVVSTSLLEPRSTLYSVAAWCLVAVLILALLCRHWGRLLVLGICWFLVGHSVESTVLPLELYFEHRNYFPGIGLFLLLGTSFALAVRSWPQLSSPLLVYISLFVVWIASLAGSQVQLWSSHPLLILNHLNGHPNSFRANADMAVQMATMGGFDAARMYSRIAYDVNVAGERSGDHAIRDLALACIARQPVEGSKIDELGTNDTVRPFGSVTTLTTLMHLLQDDACPEFDRIQFADRMVEIFLGENPRATASPNMYKSLAALENVLQRWTYAVAYIDRYLQTSPRNASGLLMKLHFQNALGKEDEVVLIKSVLREMGNQGQLTVAEQQTLLLYLEE